MANIQSIRITETKRLSNAVKSGKPFYLVDDEAKVLAYDPALDAAEKELIALLKEAEDCNEYCTEAELWESADNV